MTPPRRCTFPARLPVTAPLGGIIAGLLLLAGPAAFAASPSGDHDVGDTPRDADPLAAPSTVAASSPRDHDVGSPLRDAGPPGDAGRRPGALTSAAPPPGNAGDVPPTMEPDAPESPPAPEAPADAEAWYRKLGFQGQLYGGYNPLALAFRLDAHYRDVYHVDPESILFNGAYWQAGIMADVTPAFGRYGPYVEWMPMQIVILRLSYGLIPFHAYAGLLAYDSRDADWSEEARFDYEDPLVALAHSIRAVAEVRLKVGPLIVLSRSELNFIAFDREEPYLFDNWYGLLCEQTDWIFINRTLVLLEAFARPNGETMRVGGYHSWRRAFGADFNNERAGFAIAWEPSSGWWIFDKPMVLALIGWHVDDPFFEGKPVVLGGAGSRFDFFNF